MRLTLGWLLEFFGPRGSASMHGLDDLQREEQNRLRSARRFMLR